MSMAGETRRATRNGARSERVDRWIAAHRAFSERVRRQLRVGEAPGDPEPRTVDERLLQAIWYDQSLKMEQLVTASGKRVEVLDPGRWNTSRGPDFQGARLRIAGSEVGGDVEIHLRSSGWTDHNHHQDFEYNQTVLHVCLAASDDRPYEEKQNGERLERLLIEGRIEPDLDTIRRSINLSEYPHGRPAHVGLCHDALLEMSDTQRRELLAVAANARIEEKIARFAAQRASASVPQLIYQSLMVAQGFKSNKTLYFLLSKRAPAAELLDYAQDVSPGERAELFLAILLHVAQLFPHQGDLFDGLDDESREFVQRLQRHWRGVRGYFSDRLMPPTRRWFSGMRPPGFPGRRLAAVGELLTRLADPQQPLFELVCARIEALGPSGLSPREWKRLYKELAELFMVEGAGHYFQTHFTVGGKPARPQALLGEPAARSLLFNAVLPLAILQARETSNERLEANSWALLNAFPALPSNSVTEFMRKRLFADSGVDKSLLRTEMPNQALLKIFQDCCALNEQTCGHCTLLNPPYSLKNLP